MSKVNINNANGCTDTTRSSINSNVHKISASLATSVSSYFRLRMYVRATLYELATRNEKLHEHFVFDFINRL